MRGLGRLLPKPRASIVSFSSLLPPPRPLSNPSPLPISTAAAATTTTTTTTSPPRTPSPRPLKGSAKLTADEIAQINLLVPRLCESNHLQEAVRLVDACLLTDTPLPSLPLSVLVNRLCSDAEPDMAHAMSLLTALKHNPRCTRQALAAVGSMLLTSYFKHRRPKNALKVFDWMRRPNSPCPPDGVVYRAVVGGLCRHGKTLEALRVLREMVVSDGEVKVAVAPDVRAWVYRSLLREARVREAKELDRALTGVGEEGGGAPSGVVELLDRMVEDWRD